MNFVNIFKKKLDNFNKNLISESEVLFSKIWIQLLFHRYALFLEF